MHSLIIKIVLILRRTILHNLSVSAIHRTI